MTSYTPIEHKAIRMERWTGVPRTTWLRYYMAQGGWHGEPIRHAIAARKKQLAMGVKVEMEHKGTLKKLGVKSLKSAAKLIAEDHLKEDPQYYTKLTKAKL